MRWELNVFGVSLVFGEHIKEASRFAECVPPGCGCEQVRPSEYQYQDYSRSGDSLWSKLEPIKVDTAKLEHLFETKSKEIAVTKVKGATVHV